MLCGLLSVKIGLTLSDGIWNTEDIMLYWQLSEEKYDISQKASEPASMTMFKRWLNFPVAKEKLIKKMREAY